MSYWTLTYAGTEKVLADWGVRADFALAFHNKETDRLTLNTVETFDPANAQFPWGSALVLQRDRTLSGGSFSGGSIVFQGLVSQMRTSAEGSHQAMGYEVSGPWWLLTRLQFKQSRKVFGGWVDGPGHPSSGALLATAFTAETFLGEDPSAAMWTGAQSITEILSYANECWNATKRGATIGRDNAQDVLQIGTIDCGQVFPKIRAQAVSCAEAIVQILRYFPATVTWFDYTTSPPTLNIRDIASLDHTALTLSAQQEREVNIAPQYDRQLAGVMLCYKQVGLVDGVPWPGLYFDKYPESITDYTPNVVTHVIEIPGQKVTTLFSSVTALALAPAYSATLADRVNFWLALDPALSDPYITPGSITAGVPISVTTPAGAAIDTGVYPRMLMPGSKVASWMGVLWIEAIISVPITYLRCRDTAHAVKDSAVSGVLHLRCILTNATTGSYSGSQLLDTGELVPPCYPASGSLALAAYTSAATLQYAGSITLLGQTLRTDIALGQTLSLTGPSHTYTGLLVQSVEVRPHYGEMRVEFSPAARIDAAGLVEMWRASRWRTTYNLPSNRSSGTASISASFDTTGVDHKQDTTHSLATYTSLTIGPLA